MTLPVFVTLTVTLLTPALPTMPVVSASEQVTVAPVVGVDVEQAAAACPLAPIVRMAVSATPVAVRRPCVGVPWVRRDECWKAGMGDRFLAPGNGAESGRVMGGSVECLSGQRAALERRVTGAAR
jgi:hypothetical protein